MGRIALCHLLTPLGGVRAEFTVYEWQPGRFYLVSAGAYERHDHDYLRKLCPTDGSVRLNPITTRLGVLVIAGPNARKLLQKLTDNRSLQRGLPVALRQGRSASVLCQRTACASTSWASSATSSTTRSSSRWRCSTC
jgi:glycine cleavage system aminomethyltransferase T